MSAYICDKNHILYLVSAAACPQLKRYGGNFRWFHKATSHELPADDFAAMADAANMLLRANIKSVSYRYPNESSATLPGPNGGVDAITDRDFGWHWDVFQPVQVLKSIACYTYQSCEHPGWEDSEAHAFVHRLRLTAIDRLSGYEDAIWGAPKPNRQLLRLSSLSRRR